MKEILISLTYRFEITYEITCKVQMNAYIIFKHHIMLWGPKYCNLSLFRGRVFQYIGKIYFCIVVFSTNNV